MNNLLKKFFTLLLLALSTRVLSSEFLIKQLEADGFPRDYAEKLAVLQMRYPLWRFKPLLISKMEKRYTWEYVLYMQTDKVPSRSLVASNERFRFYFHKTDKKSYDANCRRASKEAVAYFMDPRNFLNERDIFQFLDLSYNENITEQTVQAALRGTFMERGVLEDNRSYAQWLIFLGRTFKVNPLFLAARLRQEQGIKGTPLVSGKCGDVLVECYIQNRRGKAAGAIGWWGYFKKISELKQYNGLYNFFNIAASGDGKYNIYLNGMQEAQKGSPELNKLFANDPRWNLKWKALYGGTAKLAKRYVENYQNTAYLQKWNVDCRSRSEKGHSRNFWGQYMQSISAAFSESKTTYNALKKIGLLDTNHTFLIPVYDKMPPKKSPDPAGGECKMFRTYDAAL